MTEYQLCQLIRLGRQEIHIALSNPNIDNLCSGLLCCHHWSILTLNLKLNKIKYVKPC